MWTQFCTVFFLLSGYACMTAQAQDDDLPGLKQFAGSIVFGASITQVDGDGYSGYHKIGIHGGGAVNINFSHKLGCSAEILYTQRGTRGANVKESFAIGTYFDKYYLNLNYVELPLVLVYRGLVFMEVEGGVSYGRLISYREWVDTDVPVFIDPSLTWFNKDDINYIAGGSVWLSKRWKGTMRMQYSAKYIRPWERVPERYRDGVAQHNNIVVFRLSYVL